MNAATLWKALRKRIPDVDKDDLLGAVGLESRRGAADKIVPALAIFGAGVILGVGIGMMMAPKSGAELRTDIRTRLGRGEGGEASNGAGAETGAGAA
jgi:hypothetical protein